MPETISVSSSEWFTPFPLDYYKEVGQKTSENVPDEPPIPKPYGSPLIDVRVGPIVRLLATHEDKTPTYRGTILLVTHDATSSEETPVIAYHLGPLIPFDQPLVSVRTGTFPGVAFYKEAGYTFWRYDIKLELELFEQKVVYSINQELKPHFGFFVPSTSQLMNIVSFLCNGFSLATDTTDYANSLWYDVMDQHKDIHYHVAIGGGDQLYCDKVKLVSQELQEWLEESNPLKKVNAPFTDSLAKSLEKYYLNAYIGWFGQGHWKGTNGKTLQGVFPLALASIPTINIYDDHDVIDGYGTYKHETMNTNVFKGLGKVAFKYYMLFQHHTAPHEDHHDERSWIFGAQPGPYMEELAHSNYVRLGREIGFLGLDCRTERKRDQVMTQALYQLVFKRIQQEIDEAQGEIKHFLVLLGVPIAYPRLVWLEKLLTLRALAPIRTLAQKGIIAQGLVNEFDGSVEVLDDLEDHWCASHHKKERNWLVGKLQEFGARNGVRVTILSGDVHLAAVGRFKLRIHKHTVRLKKIEANEQILQLPEQDPRLMLNVISLAITNAPPPGGMATLLQKRSKVHKFDRNTDEDVVRLFSTDVDGLSRDNDMFNNRRNWADLVLAKQLPKYLAIAKGTGKLPGLIDNDKDPQAEEKLYTQVEKNTLDRVAYPVLEDSLSTCIHIEKTSSKVNSQCARFEVLIPPLVGKQVLEGVGLKN